MTVANRKPLFVGKPAPLVTVMPATANTGRDGTGTITTIYQAAANYGSLVETIKFKATGTTTAGFINLFHSTNGSTWKMIGSVAVAAATPSSTVDSVEAYYSGTDMPFRLGVSEYIGAAPTKAEAYSASVQGGPLENLDTAPVAQ